MGLCAQRALYPNTMSKGLNLSPAQLNLAKLLELPENRHCADCSSRAPTWASFNLGMFMCIDCSGIHRTIGTHVTKVSRECFLLLLFLLLLEESNGAGCRGGGGGLGMVVVVEVVGGGDGALLPSPLL